MPASRLLVRLLTGLAALCGLILALASGIVLHGSGVLVILVLAALAAALAGGAREERQAAAACTAAVATVLAALLLVGMGVLAGWVVPVMLGVSAIPGGTIAWLVWRLRPRSASEKFRPVARSGAEAAVAERPWAGWMDTSPAPVALLSPSVLGLEWRRTTAALGTRLTAAVRQAVVLRRAEVLDEVERRNPSGFRCWLATGAADGADPTDFLARGRTPGTEAA